MIRKDVKLGKKVKIFYPRLVNLYGCGIGDYSRIAPFSEIQEEAAIGKRCTVSSHSFICSGVTLEDDVFIGHGVMFVNDLYPRSDRIFEFISTLVKNGVSIGSNATILCGITIGEHSVVGAGSVVTKNIPPFSIVAGNPAKILKQFKNNDDLMAYINKRQKIKIMRWK